MKPAPFELLTPATVEEAVAALARSGGDARILAGGQSLMPLLNFRLAAPALLVDVNRIDGLDRVVEEADGSVRVGAMVRHGALQRAAPLARRLPVLHAAMGHVAHLAIRNRGTVGGSLCHADPSAELPIVATLLDAELTAVGPAGTRVIAAGEFFLDALETRLAVDEMVTEVRFPPLDDGHGWAFTEVSRRAGDFALVAAAAVVVLDGDRAREVRLALGGVGRTPRRMREVETLATGRTLDPGTIDAAARAAASAVSPESDLHASAGYRRHLARVLTRRVLAGARERAA